MLVVWVKRYIRSHLLSRYDIGVHDRYDSLLGIQENKDQSHKYELVTTID